MPVPVRAIGSISVFELAPILTYLAGQELLTHLRGDAPIHLQWLLDMSRVKYIDSAGLGALLEFYREVHERGGSVRLVRSTERAKHLLALTGLSSILQDFDSESAAIASIEAAVVG